MKETIKINLAQRLFDLDEDAFRKLKSYLDTLKKYFGANPEEAEDILHDIEQRMAEMLDEKLKDTKQVVTLKDIEEVIELMGTPEDFAREVEYDADTTTQNEPRYRSGGNDRDNRKLFRDMDNKIIGGVAAGLASYFRVDSVWLRLAFVVLIPFNGIGLLLYLILWAVVPAAVTRSQKLRMRGKPVNIGNIEASVKDDFSRYQEPENYPRSPRTGNGFGNAIGEILRIGVKAIVAMIGIGLIFCGLALIISLIVGLTAGNIWAGWHFPGVHYSPAYFNFFGHNPWFILAVFLVVLIPIIAILIGLMRLIFNTSGMNTVLSVFIWIFWTIALVFVIVTLAVGLSGKSFGYEFTDTEYIKIPENRTLYLELDESRRKASSFEHYTIFGRDFKKSRWSDNYVVIPNLQIIRSDDEAMYLEIEYTSLFPLEEEDHWQPHKYYSLNDSILEIDEYWFFDEDDIWKLPELNLVLYVPDGVKLIIDQRFNSMEITDEEGNTWPGTSGDQRLQMSPEGLEVIEEADVLELSE
ncbi:MAG: PspC domain-containing protein [Bacteroidales bacterium]|nr:PspC domain-containing protein [Bacteroidales bacterium]